MRASIGSCPGFALGSRDRARSATLTAPLCRAPFATRTTQCERPLGRTPLAFGAFAARRLEQHALLDALLIYKGTVKTMGEYEEEVNRDMANETGHLYTMDPSHGDLGEKLTIDASAQRNCAALINDYRGRDPSAEANVRVVECYVDGEGSSCCWTTSSRCRRASSCC